MIKYWHQGMKCSRGYAETAVQLTTSAFLQRLSAFYICSQILQRREILSGGGMNMFYSVLFPSQAMYDRKRQENAPDCFKDLNLDAVFQAVLRTSEDSMLRSCFYTPLQDKDTIIYRQDVMRDLEEPACFQIFERSAKEILELDSSMDEIRKKMSTDDVFDNNELARGRMLKCAEQYCQNLTALQQGIKTLHLHSEGLLNFQKLLDEYCSSEVFTELQSSVQNLRKRLSTVEYCMLIKNGTIRVRRYEGQEDHSKQILAVFERFRQGEVKDYRHKLPEAPYAEHVEAAVLNCVAKLYKDIFRDLGQFCASHQNFLDDRLIQFSREIPFYLYWLNAIAPIRRAGLSFCYPEMSETEEELYDCSGFDLALASLRGKDTVVNDFELKKPERILVITGPNQGGKTTYARAFGQIHYFASLGLCVPGRKAKLYLFDQILTHFGREEDLSRQNGQLQDDLIRLHDLLEKATSHSILIINEIFRSTVLDDALVLGKRMMDQIADLGSVAVIVTFLDELASHGSETVSMMSTVEEEDPSRRTYRVIRKPADGLAYAAYIARKYGLSYEQLNRRLKK